MSAVPRPSTKLLLAYAALALLFLLSLTYSLRDTVDRIDEMRHGRTLAQLPFNIDLPQFEVAEVQPESRAAGLAPGDIIVAIEGEPLRRLSDLYRPLREGRAGERLTIQVESGAQAPTRRTVSIELQPMRSGSPTAADWLFFAVVNIAMPALCLALGFWIAAVRIRDKQAWLLLALLLSFAEFTSGDWRTFGRHDAFQTIAMIYQPLLGSLWPTTMMLFGIYFPDRLALDRRHPWAKWLVIVPLLAWVLLSCIVLLLLVQGDIGTAVRLDRLIKPAQPLGLSLELMAMLIFFAALGYKTFAASSPDARRRLLLLDAGAVVSILPILVVIPLLMSGLIEFGQWVQVPLLSALFVFPLTMAYVIVVHRAMDVRVVVRQGVRYLLARGSLRAVQIAVSVLILAAAATMGAAANPVNRVVLILIGLAALVLIQTSADRLRRWVDRRFFREAYQAEQILSDLANKVRTMVETAPLIETVARSVSETLHVPRVAILLNGGGTLQPVYAMGDSQVPAVPIGADSLTPDAERALQRALRSELLLPLSSNQKLIGVMSLGPKQSEEPFSNSDIRLLDAVAAQTGLALENSRLTAEIAAEVASREKARRELEIAREVQERLFPQEYPSIAGLDYAGACRPALGVGGDYYDFIRISDTELGIAIGDVSGKGIPAALLMATLRAYLRGQTIQGSRASDSRAPDSRAPEPRTQLSSMMANLNELVYESSASNRYATFFYGQYDAVNRVLRYVNGGHNPPMLFGPSRREVVRLDRGGPVIGLIQDCQYAEGCVTLEPGDVLVAFTDGITEAMDTADQEWGEERLIDAVPPNAALSARELIVRLMQEADAFVAAAPQHDDMTIVVARVL